MSAIHTTAEPGRLYLMTDGRRLRVTYVTAHAIVTRDEAAPDVALGIGRSYFESNIESVLE